ncbi:MAG: glycosyltransferase [Candidatus Omnitrophota bacterium]|nr:glycosyltransferase [Candidatus Omnitrophota bacterium]
MKDIRHKADIIIVNYNGRKYLQPCFDSLSRLTYPRGSFRVTMVDNCSTDDSVGFVRRRYPDIQVLSNDSNNYCRAANLGIRKASADFVALLNNDMRVDKKWLSALMGIMAKDKTVAAVGSKIIFDSGRLNSVGHVELPDYYWADAGFNEEEKGQYDCPGEVGSVCGGAVLYRRDYLEKAGLFDEDFVMYMEDVDICMTLRRRGWKVFYCPRSVVRHVFHGTASGETVEFYVERNRLLFIAKHFPEKLADALIGKGFFVSAKSLREKKDLYLVLPLVFKKLIECHPKEAQGILPDIFTNLRKVSDLAKADLIQQIRELEEINRGIAHKDALLDEKNAQLWKYSEHLQEISRSAQQKDIEILGKDALFEQAQEKLRHLQDELSLRGSQISERDALLAQKEQEIAGRDSQLNELSQQMQQVIAELSLRSREVTDKDALLSQKEQVLAERDARLKEASQQAQQLLDELSLRGSQISERDALLAQKEQEIARRDARLSENSQRLQALGNELTAKEAQLREKEDAILTQKNEISSRDILLDAARRQLAASEEKIQAFYASETFRFLVRPTWRFLSFCKRLKTIPFLPLSLPDKPALILSVFSTKSNLARRGEKNWYVVRVINNAHADFYARLLISIAPAGKSRTNNAAVYFCKRLKFNAGIPTEIRIGYDWQQQAAFLLNGDAFSPDEESPVRPDLPGDCRYFVKATLCDEAWRSFGELILTQELKL